MNFGSKKIKCEDFELIGDRRYKITNVERINSHFGKKKYIYTAEFKFKNKTYSALEDANNIIELKQELMKLIRDLERGMYQKGYIP